MMNSLSYKKYKQYLDEAINAEDILEGATTAVRNKKNSIIDDKKKTTCTTSIHGQLE